MEVKQHTIKFRVPCVPVAQPRPRASTFAGRTRVHEVTHIKGSDGKRKPHPILAYKATVKHAASLEYSGPPIESALMVQVTFVLPRPRNMIWKTKPMLRVPHVKKPDIDNLIKATFDALNGIIWRDDSQVFDCHETKWIASGDEQPHVMIAITSIGN